MDHMTGSEALSSPIDVVEEWITYEDESVKASELFSDNVSSRQRFNFFSSATTGYNYCGDLPPWIKLLVWVDSYVRDPN